MTLANHDLGSMAGSEKTRGIWNPEKTRTRKNPGSMIEKTRAAGTQICHDVNFEQP